MAEFNTAKALLLNAVQDLFDAERALADRLASEAGNAASDSALVVVLRDYCARAKDRISALRGVATELDGKAGGAPNIWMRAVLDDAARDAATVGRGALLDIALTGAIRKGAQAARVSYVTAFKLAERLKLGRVVKALAAMRDAHATADRRLSARLSVLVKGIDD